MTNTNSKPLSAKQAHFARFIAANPGVNTLQLHLAIGGYYAHGSHKFTYETIGRMLKRGVIVTCESRSGRGTGLRLPA